MEYIKLTEIEKNEIRAVINNEVELYDTKVYETLYDYYSDSGEMPYGAMTGDYDTPDNWILENVDLEEYLN